MTTKADEVPIGRDVELTDQDHAGHLAGDGPATGALPIKTNRSSCVRDPARRSGCASDLPRGVVGTPVAASVNTTALMPRSSWLRAARYTENPGDWRASRRASGLAPFRPRWP